MEPIWLIRWNAEFNSQLKSVELEFKKGRYDYIDAYSYKRFIGRRCGTTRGDTWVPDWVCGIQCDPVRSNWRRPESRGRSGIHCHRPRSAKIAPPRDPLTDNSLKLVSTFSIAVSLVSFRFGTLASGWAMKTGSDAYKLGSAHVLHVFFSVSTLINCKQNNNRFQPLIGSTTAETIGITNIFPHSCPAVVVYTLLRQILLEAMRGLMGELCLRIRAYRSGIISVNVGRYGVEVTIGTAVVDLVVDARRFASKLAKDFRLDQHRSFLGPLGTRRRIRQTVQILRAIPLWFQRQHETLRTPSE